MLSSFLAALLGASPLIPKAHAGSPSISVSPDNVAPGAPITITGTGFSLSDTSMTIDNGQNCPELSNTCTAANPLTLYPPASSCPVSNGQFSCVFVAPSVPTTGACASAGGAGCAQPSANTGACEFTYNIQPNGGTICTLTAVGNTNDFAGSDDLGILGGVAIYPTSGPPGTLVTVEGTGWVADFKNFFDSTALINFEDSAGNGMTVIDSNIPAQYQCVPAKSGQLDDYGACSFTAPGFEYGTYTVSVNIYAEYSVPDDLPCLTFGGLQSGCSTSATFTLVPPTVSVSPGLASSGDTLEVTGSNFATTDTSGTITIQGLDVTPSGGCPFTSSSYGSSFTCSVKVPSGLVCTGDVAATGTQYGDLAQTSFSTPSVRSSPAEENVCPLTLPSQANVGSTVTVSGSGFDLRDTSVRLTKDAIPDQGGIAIGPAGGCPLTNDAFSCTFSAPSPAGVYSIYATGDVGDDSAAGTMTSVSTLVLSQASGPVGSLLTVTGKGFSNLDQNMAFTFGGQKVPTVACQPSSSNCSPYNDLSTVCFDSAGSFSCQLLVPAVQAGPYSIVATGDQGDSQSASFQVTPSLVVSPSVSSPSSNMVFLISPPQGPPGTTVTVIGFDSLSTTTSVRPEFSGVDGEHGFFTPVGGCPVTYDTFLCVFRVPNVPPGAYQLGLKGVDNSIQPTGEAAYSAFEVSAPGSGVPSEPEFPSGSSVSITGLGFGSADSSAALTFSSLSFGPSGGCAMTSGEFSCSATLPGYQPGSYSVDATSGSDSAGTQVSLFPSLVLSQASGPAGTSVTITGDGYSSGDSTVNIYFGTSGRTICPASSSTISACSVVFPPGGAPLPAGEYLVRAVGGGGPGDAGSAGFGLTGVSIVPIQGPPGTLVTVSGAGFSPYDTSVSATVGGSAVSLSVGCTTVFDTLETLFGPASCTFRGPIISAGTYPVTLTGSTGDKASAQLQVASSPTLTLSTFSGSTGTTVTATGAGFGATDTTVSLGFDSNVVTPTGGCPVSAGAFSCQFAVPGQFSQGTSPSASPNPPGQYIFEANGNTGDFADSFFTVTTSLSLSLIQGPVGTTVGVSGGGYSAAATTLALDFGGSSVGTCGLSAGAVVEPCQFIVPTGLSGAYAVAASDSAGDQTSTQFTIVPYITLSPNTASAYATVTVSGSGFGTLGKGPDATVGLTFSFDNGLGQPVVSSTMSVGPAGGCPVSGGSFTCSFIVPPNDVSPAQGRFIGTPNIVQARGNTGDVGQAEFTAVNVLQVEPDNQGLAGNELTVLGTGLASDSSVSLLFDGQSVALASGCPVFFGSFVCSFTVPTEPAGAYSIQATGNTGDVALANQYTVSSTYSNGRPAETLVFSPSRGPVGTTVTVSGTGFASTDTSLTQLGFSSFSGNVAAYLTFTGCTMSGGAIVQPCTVVIPSAITCGAGCLDGPVTQGSWFLDAYTQSGAAYGFFVVTPSVALSSTSGLPGGSVTLTGSGFSSSDTHAQIWLGGNEVVASPGCAVTLGAISAGTCSFVIPSSLLSGVYQVYAIGSGDTAPASAILNVAIAAPTETAVACSPSPATAGLSASCTATVTGVNSPTGTVSFTSSEFSPLSCSLTKSTSTASCTVTFTPSTPGPQTVTASFAGDALDLASSGTTTLSVKAAPSITTVLSATIATVGQPVTDSATMSNGFSPGGTVAYSYFAGSSCSGTGTQVGSPVTVTGGSVPSSQEQTFTSVGAFSFEAVYGGDTDNFPATSQCEALTVQQASPTLVTTPSPPAVILGTSSPTLTDTAILAGGFSETGSITFHLSGPGGLVDTETVTVSGDGAYATPVGYTLASTGPAAGSYHWDASYSGDANNAQAIDSGSPSETVRVLPAQPSMVTGDTPASIVLGAASPVAKDTATLSGGYFPTGTITFYLYPGTGCSTSPVDIETVSVNGNGVYSSPVGYQPTAVGTYQWVGSYSGDENNNPTPSPCGATGETLSVLARTTSASLACPATSVDQATTCTVTVSDSDPGTPVTPTGSVDTLSDGGAGGSFGSPGCSLLSGTCTFTYTPPTGSAGHTITISATYQGDAVHQKSSGSTALAPTTRTSSTSLSCPTSPVDTGSPTSCIVTVTDTNAGTTTTPSGPVSLTSAPTVSSLGLPPSCALTPTGTSGVASCSFPLTPGSGSQASYSLTASYGGDADHGPSSGSSGLTVEQPNATAQGSQTTTTSGGAASSDQSSVTGISVAISGSKAPDGSSVTITTEDLSSPSNNVGVSGLGGTHYYDVVVHGITSGTARVCITSSSPVHRIHYWNGHAWASASNVVVSGDTICGDIPVSALAGTNVVTGDPKPDSMTLACSPSFEVVGTETQPLSCTATVTDTSATPTNPTGTVAFSTAPSPGSLNFPASPSCTLSPVAGSSSESQCSLASFTPASGSDGQYALTATYGGDLLQAGGSATFKLSIFTPIEAIQNLISVVNGMKVNHGITAQLVSTLRDALDLLSHGNTHGALAKLSSTLEIVSDGGQRGQIPAADAQILSTDTQAIMSALVSPSTTTVSCTPSHDSSAPEAGSSVDCTATVLGDQPGASATFTTTSSTGSFGHSGGYCNLNQGEDEHGRGSDRNTCSVEYTDSSAGTFTITASYSGDYANLPSSGSTSVTFAKASTSIQVSCGERESHGKPTVCTATVEGDGSPTGTISWSTTSSTGSFSPSSGQCTLSAHQGGGGDERDSGASCTIQYSDTSSTGTKIIATYAGDANNAASVGTVSLAFR